MSKTSQRKREMFKQGQDDYLSGRPLRWARHPLLEYYEQGFFEAKRQMEVPAPRFKSFWRRLLWLFAWGRA